MTSRHECADVARAIIDSNRYMTIATADRDGHPWPSPVWYAHAGYQRFYWISSPTARHSRNLAARRQAGIVIFDSHAPVGIAQAVYMTVTATEVTAEELAQGIHVVSARSQTLSGRALALDSVRAPAPSRLYCARMSELFVIGRSGQRIRVVLSE